jgi:hypothetical protein
VEGRNSVNMINVWPQVLPGFQIIYIVGTCDFIEGVKGKNHINTKISKNLPSCDF